MKAILLAGLCLIAPLPALAQSWTTQAAQPNSWTIDTTASDASEQEFVDANVLATFYHELGHGLIDVLQLPVLGREEDAVDTLSAILIHDLWQEDAAANMVYHTAGAFQAYAIQAESQGYQPAYWGQHSLDMQRYYNLICLFYGANPDEREDIAIDLGLPENRAMRCPNEFQLAHESWGVMLEGLEPGPGSYGLVMEPGNADDPMHALLTEEVAELNKTYGLPQEIRVGVEPCGEANAFYVPSETRIIMCTEYAADLARIWRAAE